MKLKVFKGQYGFSTLAKNGEDKMYIQVGFKKGQEPNSEKATIEMEDGFFSMYKNKVGIAFPKLVVMKYVELDEGQPVSNNEMLESYPDDLPF
jgi:hypothetical protein